MLLLGWPETVVRPRKDAQRGFQRDAAGENRDDAENDVAAGEGDGNGSGQPRCLDEIGRLTNSVRAHSRWR